MVYIIKGGDTLFKIAQSYTGNGNRYPELLDVNPQIKNPDFIREGDLLNIPDAWSGGSPSLPATQETAQSEEDAPGMSTNTKVMLIAGVAALGAGIYWYMGQKKVAAQNPEEDEEFEEEVEDDEDEE